MVMVRHSFTEVRVRVKVRFRHSLCEVKVRVRVGFGHKQARKTQVIQV